VINLFSNLLLAAGVAGVAWFVALYSLRAPWWANEVGWHLVTFTTALGALMANGLIFRIVGDYPGRQIVNLVLFTVVVVSVWWRVALLYRATRGGNR
jgi:hypothetical protein